ncbi:uncharacterized protein LOC118492094 [Helianthus annuus]|uniref:uncharacterized protein LOC118492094 n=1 Tax=Helianthus annuus TaxID=4232 RepID=UPI001653414E|nr:uncharacterized protein LOC118492094 [Helianthus annuus]
MKGVEIPIENHILCDPPTPAMHSVAKQEIDPIKESMSTVKSENVLYTLVGDVFEDTTSKFLGKEIPRVIVTQCDPIPKSEVRKQYGNQRLPTKHQSIASKGRQQDQRAQKPKVSQPKFETKGARYKKKRTSTFGSTSSTSGCQSESPKFVKRRSCFKCGEFGHIIKNCTNSPKENFVERAPPEKGHQQRRSVSPQQDKHIVKELETKQRRQNVKAIERALKPEVKSVKKEPSSLQPLKSETSESVNNTWSGKRKESWKPKTVSSQGET